MKRRLLSVLLLVALAAVLFAPAASANCFDCRSFYIPQWGWICIGCWPVDQGFSGCIEHPFWCCSFYGSVCDTRIVP